RRHTRFARDWSSDVCSSDLSETAWRGAREALPPLRDRRSGRRDIPGFDGRLPAQGAPFDENIATMRAARESSVRPPRALPGSARSEERRVGKWGKDQGAADY